MVKKLLQSLGFFIFFLLALMAFMPKESFYYLLEKELKSHEIVISNESLDAGVLSLDIKNLEINIKGIEGAVAQSASVTIFGIYNTLMLENIELSSLVTSYVPATIESLRVSYTFLNPLVIKMEAKGDFGEAKGDFSLLERTINLKLNSSQLLEMQYQKSLKMLTQEAEGEYSYAKSF